MEPISVEEAQRLVLERAKRLDAERVPLERAYGRVLAEPVGAAVDLPPFPSSAMDGFALRSADTAAAPVSLTLAGSVAAGAPSTRPLGSGEAMAISTGGVVPDGADAVIPIELARTVDGRVEITEAVTAGHERARARRGRHGRGAPARRGHRARRGPGGSAGCGRHRRKCAARSVRGSGSSSPARSS